MSLWFVLAICRSRVLANAATVAREFEVKVRVLIGDAANQRGGEVGVLFNAENEDEFDYILIKWAYR